MCDSSSFSSKSSHHHGSHKNKFRVNNTVLVDPKYGVDRTGEFESEIYKFRTVNGAIEMAKRYASSANPVRVSLAPGAYFEGQINLYDGLSIEATGRLTATIYGYFNIGTIGNGQATVLEISVRAFNTPAIVNIGSNGAVPLATFRRMSLVSTFTNQASQQFTVNAPGSQIAISDNSEVQLISYGGGEAANFNYVNTQLAVERTTNSNSVTLTENTIVPVGASVELSANTPQFLELTGNNTINISGNSSYILVQSGEKPSIITFTGKAYNAATGKSSKRITLNSNERLDIFAYEIVNTIPNCNSDSVQSCISPTIYYSFSLSLGRRRLCLDCSTSLTSSIYRVSSEGPNTLTLDSIANTIIPTGESVELTCNGNNVIEMFGNNLQVYVPISATGPATIKSNLSFVRNNKVESELIVPVAANLGISLLQSWINQESTPRLVNYYLVVNDFLPKGSKIKKNKKSIKNSLTQSDGITVTVTTKNSPYTLTSTETYYITAIGPVVINIPVNPPKLALISTDDNDTDTNITVISQGVSIPISGRTELQLDTELLGQLYCLGPYVVTLNVGESYNIPNYTGLMLVAPGLPFTINLNSQNLIYSPVTVVNSNITSIMLVTQDGATGNVQFDNIVYQDTFYPILNLSLPITGNLTLTGNNYVLTLNNSDLTVKSNISAMVLASNYRGINHNALDPNLSLAVHLEHTDENHSTSGGVVSTMTGQITVTINGAGGTEMSPYTVTSTDSYITTIGAVTLIFNAPGSGSSPGAVTINTGANSPNVMVTLVFNTPDLPSMLLPGRTLYTFLTNEFGSEMLVSIVTTLKPGDIFTISGFSLFNNPALPPTFTINAGAGTTIIGPTTPLGPGFITKISVTSNVATSSVIFQNVVNAQTVATPFTGSLILTGQIYTLVIDPAVEGGITVLPNKNHIHHRSYLKQIQVITGGNTSSQSIYVPQYPPAFIVVINNPVSANLKTLTLYANSSHILLNDSNLSAAQLATYPQYIIIEANSEPLLTPTVIFGANLPAAGIPVPLGTNGQNSYSITLVLTSLGYVPYGSTSAYNAVENVSLDNDVLVSTGTTSKTIGLSQSPYDVQPSDTYIIASGAVTINIPAVSSFVLDTRDNSTGVIVTVNTPIDTVFPLAGRSVATFQSSNIPFGEIITLLSLVVELQPNDSYTVTGFLTDFNSLDLGTPAYTINVNTNTTVILPSSVPNPNTNYVANIAIGTLNNTIGANVTFVNVIYQNVTYTSVNPLTLETPIMGNLTVPSTGGLYTLTLNTSNAIIAQLPTPITVINIAPVPDIHFYTKRRLPTIPNLNLTTNISIIGFVTTLPVSLRRSLFLLGRINQISGSSTLSGTYDSGGNLLTTPLTINPGDVYRLNSIVVSRGVSNITYGFYAVLEKDTSNINLNLNKVTVTNGNNIPQLLLSNHPSALVHNDKITAFQGKKLLQVSYPKGNQNDYPVHEHSTQGEHRHGGTFNSTLTNLVVNQTFNVTENDKIVVVAGGAIVNLPLIVTLNNDRNGVTVPVGTITVVFGTQYDVITETNANTPSTIVAADGDMIESPPGIYQQSISLPVNNNVTMTAIFNADKVTNQFVWVPSYTSQRV